MQMQGERTMNWDNIEDNWKHFKSDVTEQWGTLTDGQLAGRVLDKCEELDEGEELSDWQQRQREIKRVR
jgi:hypothetical protein